MLNESLGLSSASVNTGVNKISDNDDSKFFSSSLYNRHTHDENVIVKVAEIDFTISVESILNSAKDKDKLLQLISTNFSSLFSQNLVEEIETLTKEDLMKICIYDHSNDSFCGHEYYLLKHLMDSHIQEFIEDLINGRLDKLIQLSVSDGNLFVKTYPSKSASENQVSYMVSLLYLVLLHLYKHLHPYENIHWLIETLFIRVKPIITLVKYTVATRADDNYTWYSQLNELKSAYGFFAVNTDGKQVRFLFRPREEYLTSTLNYSVANKQPSQTNETARLIECTYALEKDNILKCETVIVGKEMVDCVFATLIDTVDEPASIYSALSDDESIYLANYSILHRLLSCTNKHEKLKSKLNLRVRNLIQEGKLNLAQDVATERKVQWFTNKYTIKNAFKDVEILDADDKLILKIEHELMKLKIKNDHVPYVIVILELLRADSSVIKEALAPLDKDTTSIIKKIITKLRRCKIAPGFSLNEFYRG